MEIKKIAVIGAGTMGHGIAQVSALSGLGVGLVDIQESFLDQARAKIAKSLERMVKANKISSDQAATCKGSILYTSDLGQAAADADLVIESVPERLELKKETFRRLNEICSKEAILTTNTSQLSVTAMASQVSNPERVAGMHWFNPPPMMKLIELVRAEQTSDSTLAILKELTLKMGKVPIISKDSQGFITSRAFSAHMLECFRIHEEGLATMEDIDTGIRLALGYPMGPFELADYVGLDVIYHASLGLYQAFGDRFLPPQSLTKKVEAGHHGVKTGRGFYTYPREQK